jgi:sugar O-acyltransferase (sialic acid O-acetyltransferase NeuD family)
MFELFHGEIDEGDMRNNLAIVGAGALGLEVMELAAEATLYEQNEEVQYKDKFFVDSKEFAEQNCVSDEEFLKNTEDPSYIIAIASPAQRKHISEVYKLAGAKAITAISKHAHVSISATIGNGSIIQKFSSISSNTSVGECFIANFHTYIGHDCRIGSFVTVSPGVSIGGNVHIEDSVFIGAGATIRNGTNQNPIKIGESAVIGMGAVVIGDVQAFSVVAGNPARVI